MWFYASSHFSVSPSLSSHIWNCLGFHCLFQGERIKYLTRLTVRSETSRNEQQRKEELLKGNFPSSRDTIRVANFRDYIHINSCSENLILQIWLGFRCFHSCNSIYVFFLNRSHSICPMLAFLAGNSQCQGQFLPCLR